MSELIMHNCHLPIDVEAKSMQKRKVELGQGFYIVFLPLKMTCNKLLLQVQ